MSLHLSFHSMIILAYTIPGIYLFLRIWQLFIDRHFDKWYIIIYILVAMVYPASNLLSEKDADLQYLKVIPNYLLPFFLYLFLCVLVFDILILLNRLFRLIPSARLKSPRVKKICLASILFLSAAIVTGGVINFNTIRISRYKIDIPGKSSRIRHLKIAFAADFHLQERSGVDFVERFAGKINEIKPDIMIFGGDIIENDNNGGDIQTFESDPLNLIRSVYRRQIFSCLVTRTMDSFFPLIL